MSGIAAIFDRSGTVARETFDAVFDALDHRGWDGSDVVVRDRVALGHHHAYTTPAEVGERQPISLDDCWLAMDGRVDNRAELMEALAEAGDSPDTGVSDAELVLRGYRAWGDALLDRLVGAFALALWDAADERLLVARDKTGILRDAYYADCGDVVVVASEMGAVLEHPAVSTRMNEGLVGEVLVGRFMPPGETFYADVRHVRPGSVVEVTAGGARRESYWEPWNATVDRDPSKDVTEEYLARLEEAVACRLRGRKLPGVTLSGGLDSTTVTCVADRYVDRAGDVPDGDLQSFSLVLDDDFFDAELERLHAVVERCGVEPHTLRAADHYTLEDVELHERAARESPVFNGVIQANARLFEAASEAGRDVLLTGIGGNAYDGNRFYYLDLLRSGRLATFLRHARADPTPLRQLLLWFVLVPSSDRVAALARRRYGDEINDDVPEWVAADFVERTDLEARVAEDLETGFSSVAKELMFKFYYRTDRRFEDAAKRREALRAGVDLRCPYLDSRLLSFLFSLPSWETFEAGEDKALVRRAMEGILPEPVRTQDAAVHFSSVITEGVRDERRAYVDDLLADSELVERGIVDEAGFESYIEEAIDGGELVTRYAWRVVCLELWLRERSPGSPERERAVPTR